jgi:hypothetical protein
MFVFFRDKLGGPFGGTVVSAQEEKQPKLCE